MWECRALRISVVYRGCHPRSAWRLSACPGTSPQFHRVGATPSYTDRTIVPSSRPARVAQRVTLPLQNCCPLYDRPHHSLDRLSLSKYYYDASEKLCQKRRTRGYEDDPCNRILKHSVQDYKPMPVSCQATSVVFSLSVILQNQGGRNYMKCRQSMELEPLHRRTAWGRWKYLVADSISIDPH